MMPCEQLGHGRPVCEPQQERQISQYACDIIGCPSLWVLTLGQARESTSAVRPKTDLKLGVSAIVGSF